ncbi:MAG: ABC transporter permease subunit [Caldithrix sp.]|nr:ABC transporter permease subunit [Caldithrix sp.]
MFKRHEHIKFLFPALFLLALVAFFPLAYGIVLSFFRKMPVFHITDFTGLDNIIYLFSDLRFQQSLWNTLLFTVISVALEVVLGVGVAILMKQKVPGNRMLKAFILLPWAIPTVVSAKMWQWIYNGDFGILNVLLMETGILHNPVNWLGHPQLAMASIIIADVWKTTPFVALLVYAGLLTIPDDLYDSSKIDGAGDLRRFWYVILPLIMPVILIVTIFRMMDALRVFDVVYVLTGGGPANLTETLSIYAYKLLFQTLQFGYGSTVSIMTFFIIMILSSIYIYQLYKRFNYMQ